MDNFKIFETDQFLEDLEQDFSGRQDKIKLKLKSYVYPQLRMQPFYGSNIKKLVNYNPDTWRYRIGQYRFFYLIDDKKKVVMMISADSRGSAY
ncbi:MAG: hypothetical protein A3I11_01890 [Elusimicrobia bacterium RIFCSPLOWO2_02_FULL_39_32]|nr:MAG: hypothetical protein A3I11_01890 [Elusimicrobia bacterium RIFCSPLOWO2_02_FULL_39_32]